MIDSIDRIKLDVLLRSYNESYNKEPKQYYAEQNSKVKEKLLPPRVPPISVPTPKFTKVQKKMKSNPMALRKRENPIHNYSANYKSTAAQHLYTMYHNQINHSYVDSGKEMIVDSLLKANPKVWQPQVSNELDD